MSIPRSWEDIVHEKRSVRQNNLGLGIGQISTLDDEDTDCVIEGVNPRDLENTSQYLASLSYGRNTCQSSIEAFIKRAQETHQSTNCFTEVAFQDARMQAKELDKYFSENGTLLGPLHGVPVTLKDQFNLAGYDSTIGYVAKAFKPANEDAVLVQMLKSLGAIILGKSNLPQSIMWCETENPLWGLTTHPNDSNYTPGGSTGGEAVLLASRASLLGWGTDIGGSIRIPSHIMGLYGLKPSSSRLPYRDVPVSTEGQEHVPSSVGPMASDLFTIELAMRSIISLEPWRLDARCVPMPWREDIFLETLRCRLTIGVLHDDGKVRPHPPVSRVLSEVIKKLEDGGHDIVQWNADLHVDCIEIMDQFYTADGGQDIRDNIKLGGEPMIPHVEALTGKGTAISVYEYWQLNKRKFDLQQAYLDKWNNIRCSKTDRQVDVLLMPPMPHAAVPHKSCRWVGYTKVWNFLDYSAMTMPAGKVAEVDLSHPWDYETRGDLDASNSALWRENKERMADLGLSVGVQLVCRKLEEEKLLAAGRIIDALVNGGA